MNTRRILFTLVTAALVAVLLLHVTRTPTARAAASGGVIACTLKNGPTVVSGPGNMVTATCTAPSQVVDTADNDTSGLSTNAVVNITGPAN